MIISILTKKNGTFKEQLREYLSHTSYSSMGVDIADINNDSLVDIVTMDMLPKDNERQKLLIWPDNWNVYQAQLSNGFWHQNMRNMLQLNQGNNHFSEIGQLAGISNTDWSWGVLLADFDLDGFKDIFISNGLAKDLTNIDFVKYFDENTHLPLNTHLKQMTTSKTKNYIFRNNHNLTFENKQKEWGFDLSSISNGTITADLDNDGDLDIVTNNLNEPSKIYKNNTRETQKTPYIKVKLIGNIPNLNGIGATITIKQNSKLQTQEVSICHGFQSSSIGPLIFGVENEKINLIVKWQNGKVQEIESNPNQTITLYQKNSWFNLKVVPEQRPLYAEINEGVNYTQEIAKINNFNNEILLPNHYSYFGPKMATGDLDGDQKEDLVVAGTNTKIGQIFLNKNNKFIAKNSNFDKKNNQNVVISDMNNDGFKDIYFANGCYENASFDLQNDEIWLNDSHGNFKTKITLNDQINNQTVNIFDIDRDGDMDVFIGGFIKPNKYPFADESCFLINEGNGKYRKQSLGVLGLISGSVYLQKKLILVGEWMPPSVFEIKNQELVKDKNPLLDNLSGWWNTIEKGDLDNDGDEDLVLGNMGLNTQIKASTTVPASIIYDDFDKNEKLDFFISYNIDGKSYPAYSRDEIGEQIPMLRKKFTNYASYSNATVQDFFEPSQIEKAKKMEIKELNTLILENKNGDFEVRQLPIQAQFSPIYAIMIADLNNDGKKDILLGGNNDKFRIRIGLVSANEGQLFINHGNFKFEYLPQYISGFKLIGNSRSIVKIENNLFFGMNNDKTLSYSRQ